MGNKAPFRNLRKLSIAYLIFVFKLIYYSSTVPKVCWNRQLNLGLNIPYIMTQNKRSKHFGTAILYLALRHAVLILNGVTGFKRRKEKHYIPL